MPHPTTSHHIPWRWLAPLLIVAAGCLAYRNSFGAPFLYDDRVFIVENLRIRQIAHAMEGTSRPLVYLLMAVNYAWGGLDPRGYHAVNLLIHLLAGLALFGVVRRTLISSRLRSRYGAGAFWIALSVALVWVAHPLQTESVTYLYQRAESLAGLWYLATLYCVIRDATQSRHRWWAVSAVVACFVGMASKPVMATAPLMMLAYDRTLISGTVRAAWRRRRALYVGLAASWGLLVWLLMTGRADYGGTGIGIYEQGMRPGVYLLTQPSALLRYLRLAFWPSPLCFDYGWSATPPPALMPQALLIIGLVLAAGWAFVRSLPVGFLGLWFFLILAPTSLIPSTLPTVEHRMYLPLAALCVFAVLGGRGLITRCVQARGPWRRWISIALASFSVAGLGALTVRRNEDYRSEDAMWRDVIATQPMNARAFYSLGTLLGNQNKPEEAIPYFVRTIELQPNYIDAYYNLGVALIRQGKREEAIPHLAQVLWLARDNAARRDEVSGMLLQQGMLDGVVAYLKRIEAGHPGDQR